MLYFVIFFAGDPDDQIIKYNERNVIPAFQREVIVHLYCSMQEEGKFE